MSATTSLFLSLLKHRACGEKLKRKGEWFARVIFDLTLLLRPEVL
jgi:hypothetical protein